MTKATPMKTDSSSEMFFIAIPRESYIALMEKAKEKQTTVAILLGNALKYAIGG